MAAGRAGAFLSRRWPKCSQPHLKASPTCRPLASSLTSSPSEPGRSLRCLPCGGAGREPQCSQHWSPRSRERVPTCHRRLFLVSRARLQGHLYFPHLTDRETEAREGMSLCPHVGLGPEMAQLGAGACFTSPKPPSGPPRAQCGVHGFAAPPCPPCPVAVQGEASRSQLSTPRPRLQKQLFLSSTPEWVALGTHVPDLWMATVLPPRTPLSVLGQIKSLTSIKSSCSHCAHRRRKPGRPAHAQQRKGPGRGHQTGWGAGN